jgi:hypothetical protein
VASENDDLADIGASSLRDLLDLFVPPEFCDLDKAGLRRDPLFGDIAMEDSLVRERTRK